MALSAQNQSTSYVNLYYSIVQRAATRYFKEYYNSGKYRIRTHARAHACVHACHRYTRNTRIHTHTRTHTNVYTDAYCRICKKSAPGMHPRRRIRRRARIARVRLQHRLGTHPPLSLSPARLVRRILSLMSVTGAGSHLCVHVSAKRDVIVCAASYTRGFEFSRRPSVLDLPRVRRRPSALRVSVKPDSNSGYNFDRLARSTVGRERTRQFLFPPLYAIMDTRGTSRCD